MDLKSHYTAPNAYKYGLKITSPFVEDFSKVVAGGGEVVYVAAGTHKTLMNDLSGHRLIVVDVEEGGSFEYEERSSGQSVKSDLHVFLRGKNAKVTIQARYELDGVAKLDILHRVYHEADGTSSEIETRGALWGESHLIYRSGIRMEEGSRATKGKEDARFIVLSKAAKIDAIPALDISAKETSTSHALSIRRISDAELFYPKLRGLDAATAEALVLEGFLK
ncbi:MAG: SufD family Fe-S cluster assembly protein [bacterium]|nr:SufD family Fe-S cluster assembly protein [bacterium]